jgi:hypothetical protein
MISSCGIASPRLIPFPRIISRRVARPREFGALLFAQLASRSKQAALWTLSPLHIGAKSFAVCLEEMDCVDVFPARFEREKMDLFQLGEGQIQSAFALHTV